MADIMPSDFYKVIHPHLLTQNNAERELSLKEFTNYKPCEAFTNIQNRYQKIYDLGFLSDLGVIVKDGKIINPYSGFIEHFSQVAASAPKNLVQQSIFPYGSLTHAQQGNGTQLFCEGKNDNFYQMGTLRLKGHIVLQDIQVEGRYENTPVTASAQEIYFVISEFKDKNVEKLPYLQTIEGKKAVFL